MEAIVYNTKGEKAGKIELPAALFGLPWNADLVHQVVTAMQANARQGNAHTKDRGEVRGGGKKPWKQKGTGRARHGSSRSPIWKGGGMAHGPRNTKDYSQKINRQVAQKALLVALSRKLKDGEVIFVDTLNFPTPKTADGKRVLTALAGTFPKLSKTKNAALITLPAAHEPTRKSFTNMGHVAVAQTRNLNPVSVFGSKYLIMVDPQATLDMLSQKRVSKASPKKNVSA